uniref:Uncharacterized protein n=1 Tax=Anopheles minimus TaxID=112268 RepID=A0A182WQ61_9DIPT
MICFFPKFHGLARPDAIVSLKSVQSNTIPHQNLRVVHCARRKERMCMSNGPYPVGKIFLYGAQEN